MRVLCTRDLLLGVGMVPAASQAAWLRCNMHIMLVHAACLQDVRYLRCSAHGEKSAMVPFGRLTPQATMSLSSFRKLPFGAGPNNRNCKHNTAMQTCVVCGASTSSTTCALGSNTVSEAAMCPAYRRSASTLGLCKGTQCFRPGNRTAS